MAALSTLSPTGTGTRTRTDNPLNGQTMPVTYRAEEQQSDDTPRPRYTVSRIDKNERGDEKKKDLFEGAGINAVVGITGREAASLRQTVATEVVRAIGRVIAAHGTIKMAADLQLLKKRLSRCHDELGQLRSESDFLSIAVCVEMALGTKNWKEITRQELAAQSSYRARGSPGTCHL